MKIFKMSQTFDRAIISSDETVSARWLETKKQIDEDEFQDEYELTAGTRIMTIDTMDAEVGVLIEITEDTMAYCQGFCDGLTNDSNIYIQVDDDLYYLISNEPIDVIANNDYKWFEEMVEDDAPEFKCKKFCKENKLNHLLALA